MIAAHMVFFFFSLFFFRDYWNFGTRLKGRNVRQMIRTHVRDTIVCTCDYHDERSISRSFLLEKISMD